MGEITQFDSEINAALDQAFKNIEGLSKKDPSQKKGAAIKCQSELKQIAIDIESYELEISQQSKHKEYDQSLAAIKQRFDKAKVDLENKKNEGKEGDSLSTGRSTVKNLGEMTGTARTVFLCNPDPAGELMQKGDETMDACT